MALAVATTFAVILWIVLWALGVSGHDGLMLAALIVLIVGGIRALGELKPAERRGPAHPGTPRGGW
jgi:hypothetical protein